MDLQQREQQCQDEKESLISNFNRERETLSQRINQKTSAMQDVTLSLQNMTEQCNASQKDFQRELARNKLQVITISMLKVLYIFTIFIYFFHALGTIIQPGYLML